MIHQFITPWEMLVMLSLFYFALGGELCHFFISAFKMKFCQSGAIFATASAADHEQTLYWTGTL
jgi:hypothetical protein